MSRINRIFLPHNAILVNAIRRAVSVAREHDERAAASIASITQNVLTDRVQGDDYLVDVECSANNAWHHRTCALEIRRTIRTAIESDKA